MQLAIAEDDTTKLQSLQIPAKQLISRRFDDGMNVLNLAIDQQRVNIVQYLASTLSEQDKQSLMRHRYLGISAIH